MVDGTLLVANTNGLTAYSLHGEQRWSTAVAVETEHELPVAGGVVAVIGGGVFDAELVGIEVATDVSDPGHLVVGDGALYLVGYDLVEVDPRTGASELVLDDVNASDVAAVGDRLVVAGTNTLGGLPLPLPPPEEREAEVPA